MAFVIESAAFRNGEPILTKYTRDGQNLSPPLYWTGAPADTRSYVVIVEDPDAPSGTFRHWGMYNIPASETELPEGASSGEPGAIMQARNDFGHAHYDGPEPPKGHGLHHYHFRVAALALNRLDLQAESTVAEVWEAARPSMIAEAELIGTYER
ncbi:MAG TPA: YbhB/YbcL family Raf kinase inhibitor-like protein [Gemmatimonadales bacterium]|jgi:Raf kinase inhibitor-like YbhB/YbcL family protein